jgi:hypothetical protein
MARAKDTDDDAEVVADSTEEEEATAESPSQEESDEEARKAHEPPEMTAPPPEEPLSKSEQAKLDKEARDEHDNSPEAVAARAAAVFVEPEEEKE